MQYYYCFKGMENMFRIWLLGSVCNMRYALSDAFERQQLYSPGIFLYGVFDCFLEASAVAVIFLKGA